MARSKFKDEHPFGKIPLLLETPVHVLLLTAYYSTYLARCLHSNRMELLHLASAQLATNPISCDPPLLASCSPLPYRCRTHSALW